MLTTVLLSALFIAGFAIVVATIILDAAIDVKKPCTSGLLSFIVVIGIFIILISLTTIVYFPKGGEPLAKIADGNYEVVESYHDNYNYFLLIKGEEVKFGRNNEFEIKFYRFPHGVVREVKNSSDSRILFVVSTIEGYRTLTLYLPESK